MVFKGMPESRNDRIGAFRIVAGHTVDVMLSPIPNSNVDEIITGIISGVIDMYVTRRLRSAKFSKHVKKDETSYFEFKIKGERTDDVECVVHVETRG